MKAAQAQLRLQMFLSLWALQHAIVLLLYLCAQDYNSELMQFLLHFYMCFHAIIG